jgi:hypothetical protein
MTEEPYLNDNDLKPCPFCGGEANVSEGTMGGGETLRPWWYIECDKCSATCESVEAWNARIGANDGTA